MDARAGAPNQVHIRLSADDTMDIRERSITLDSDKTSIPIGRVSKIESKGFVAAEDNGWFDSPVMSRQHAEIVADLGKQKVQVRDLGSLHGTFLNSTEKLPAKELCDLRDGDELSFGLPILRGNTEYKPTTVKVGIAFKIRISRSYDTSTFRDSSTFQVPDGSECSDCSSDDGEYHSDNSGDSDVSEEEGSVCPGSPKDPRPPQIIDLTQSPSEAQDVGHAQKGFSSDDTHSIHAQTEIIDLSSPPSSPPASLPDLFPREAASDVDELEEEDEHDEFDLEDDDMDGTAVSSTIFTFGEQSRGLLAAMDSSDEETEWNPAPPIEEDEPYPFIDLVTHNRAINDDSDGDSYMDYPSDSLSASDVGSDEEADYDSGSESDENMSENVSSDEDEDDVEGEDDDQSLMSDADSIKGTVWDAAVPDYQDFSMHVAPPLISFAPAAKATTLSFKIPELLNNATTDDGHSQRTSFPRGTSPSKNFYSTPSHSNNKTSAQELGARTGKVDYFAAREDNKLAVNAYCRLHTEGAAPSRRHTSSIHTLCNDQEPTILQFNTAVPDNTMQPRGSTDAQTLPSVYTMGLNDDLNKNRLTTSAIIEAAGLRNLRVFAEELNNPLLRTSSSHSAQGLQFDKAIEKPLAADAPPSVARLVSAESVKAVAPEPAKAIAPEPAKAVAPEPAKAVAPKPINALTPGPANAIVSEPVKFGRLPQISDLPQIAPFPVPKPTCSPVQDTRRTVLAISDMVESHQHSSPKRKSDDISEVTAEEKEWVETGTEATQSVSSVESAREPSSESTVASSLDSEPIVTDLVAKAATVQDTADTSIDSQTSERPIKRMRLRRLAESVGMAALGGAMVMGTLIYTAPTFA
ncbi:hypothetical protein QBC35DRAFT_469430 [Podospora australis]|uniref:FHA domain-containing protein n=1 Tax=Podospora australis TaxID=1536484 RepID=A0AAN6X869_9PEZI|nr:hypothetical protein QBC35DRAFT_469430 [Podospora australis]